LSIIKGEVRLRQIDRQRVEKVSYSDKGNMVLKYKEEDEWKFVLDDNGNKIHKRQIQELRKAIANPAAIDWLISQIGKK